MKLLRYGPKGQERPGLLDAEGRIRDLSDHVKDIGGATLLDDTLDRLRKVDIHRLPIVQTAQRLGPCVGSVGKFICIGLNYADHAAESNLPIPKEPIVFLKANSAICGLIARDSQGIISGPPFIVTANNANLAALTTEGVDFQVDWAIDLANISDSFVLSSVVRF